jgi:NADPH-dependent glutamate synthase beta subunit-like oxidoreductase
MVLLAMGFMGPEKAIIEQLNLNQDNRSNIETSPGKYATSVARVYAAGGCKLALWSFA